MATTASWYHPAEHVLSRLGLQLEPERGRARLPITDGIVTEQGDVRIGAIGALVDSAAGGLGVLAARPNWLVTTFLDLRLWAAPMGDAVIAEATVLRGGRSSFVITAELSSGHAVGHATVGFAVLPQRDGDPAMPDPPPGGTVQLGEYAGLDEPLLAVLGTRTIRPESGETETKLGPAIRNNLGVLNGGVICMLAEEATILAGSVASGAATTVSQLTVTFVSQVHDGPVLTDAEVRGVGNGSSATVRARVVDGASGRLAAVAMATVGRAPHHRREEE